MLQILASYDTNAFCRDTYDIWALIGTIIKIIRIAIPILIVLLGTIDLGKAVLAGDDKKIKEAQGMLVRRIIYGVAVFFVLVIVQTIFGTLGKRNTADDSSLCWQALSGEVQDGN
jgi:surface polysaccharide O-acyltransferase-like enzyme